TSRARIGGRQEWAVGLLDRCDVPDGGWIRVVYAFQPPSASDAVLAKLREILARPDFFSGALLEEAETTCKLARQAQTQGHGETEQSPIPNCAKRLKKVGQESMGRIERAAMNRDLIALAFPQIGDSPTQFGRRPLIAFLLLLGLYVALAVALNFQLG